MGKTSHLTKYATPKATYLPSTAMWMKTCQSGLT